MENRESILDELTNFEKRRPKEIPQILEDYLTRIAKTGDTMFPWTKLKPLFMFKMELVMSEFYKSCPTDDILHCPNVDRFKYDVMREKLLEAVDNFNSSAPFTIQRLCELVTTPRKHYRHTDKFMRGLEKNVLVVSTVEPGCSHIYACDCARKRSEHQTAMMNGVTETSLNGVEVHGESRSETHEEDTKESNSNNPSSPSDVLNGLSKERVSDPEIDSCDVLKDDGEKRLEMPENVVTNAAEDNQENVETKDDSESKNDDSVSDENKESLLEEKELKTEKYDDETNEMDELSVDTREPDEQNEISASQTNICYPEEERESVGLDNLPNSQIETQPSISDLNSQDLPPVSIVTTVGEDDEDDDCGATGDNEDEEEMSVSMSLPIRDEAADLDDNTMDVPTSDNVDGESNNLLPSTSQVMSAAETLVATSDDDSRHSHDRQEPMEED